MSTDAALLERIHVTIDMHDSGCGRFIARIVQDCRCGQWGITATLASWSNLKSLTKSALIHLATCTDVEQDREMRQSMNADGEL